MVIIFFLLGLCVGSFVNAFVWRLRQQDKLSKITSIHKKQSTEYSILKGRSMCPNCKHELSWYDLIPVVSWVLLKGKCRYCKKPISSQYPFVEIVTALLFVMSYLFWPNSLSSNLSILVFITWLVVLTGLISLAIYDVKWMILPDRIIYPLIIFVLLSLVLQFALGRSAKDILAISTAVLISGGIFWVLYQMSDGKWIGGGDVKLGLLIGLVLAIPSYALLYIFLASLLGTLFILPFLMNKKIKTTSKIPFGPFLIAGSIIVVLFGQNIIDWYLAKMII